MVMTWESKFLLNLDLVFKTCQTIRKQIWVRIFNLLLCSKRLKFNDFPVKLKCLESNWKNMKDSYLMRQIIKFKFVNWLKNVSLWKDNGRTTEIRWKNSTKYAKPFIMKIKCSNHDFLKWIFPWNKSLNQRSWKMLSWCKKFRNGNQDIKQLKSLRQSNYKIYETWWNVNESQWLTDKLEKWLSDSRIKEPPYKIRSEKLDNFWTIEIVR